MKNNFSFIIVSYFCLVKTLASDTWDYPRGKKKKLKCAPQMKSQNCSTKERQIFRALGGVMNTVNS